MARIETALGEKELAAAGRVMRRLLPRSAHAVYEPAPGRDPLGILRTQQSARLQWLIQLRLERMSANPFAFYRGTAAIQAADLRNGPDTGAEVVICGDAHLSNFGIYRSPENAMVFDINDFDEAGRRSVGVGCEAPPVQRRAGRPVARIHSGGDPRRGEGLRPPCTGTGSATRCAARCSSATSLRPTCGGGGRSAPTPSR